MMKRIDRHKLESKIRDLQLEPICENENRMEEIKQRAFEEYMRRQSSQPFNPQKPLRHNVMVVAAATAGILIFSFAFSVFAPVAVSSANQYVRRAALWINNTLHLGFEYPEPVEDAAKIIPESPKRYSTLESAAQALSTPLLCIDQSGDLQLDKVETFFIADGVMSVQISYLATEGNFSISISPLGDETIIAPLLSEAILLDTQLGEMAAWKTTDGDRALIVFKGSMVQISSTLPFESFLSLCGSIKEFT